MPRPPHAVLFVCLGNICRSPLAKAVFMHQAVGRGVREQFLIDSCGTGHWHVGGPADPRTIAVATRRGVPIAHTARQFDPATDIERFDLLLAMDRDNAAEMRSRGAPAAKVRLFREFDGTAAAPDLNVPDPYLGGPEGFDEVFEMVSRASAGLLDQLLRTPGAPRG